ncbi:hypothetical protein C8R44DRAFT_644554, partial [Mycena epipterygia]
IYRCFIIWDRNWSIVILPILLWLGTAVTGYGATHGLLLVRQGGVLFEGLAPWITTFFALSLTLNIICTSKIQYRVYSALVSSKCCLLSFELDARCNSDNISGITTYSSSLLVLLIAYVLNSNTQYIALDVVGHSLGYGHS